MYANALKILLRQLACACFFIKNCKDLGAFPDELILESKPAEPPKRNGNRFPRWWLAAAAFILIARLVADKVADWAGGEPKLSPKEQRKLEKELREIDEAEQYVLLAESGGWYPCLKCPTTQIFLHMGEVWKYGVTRKGQYGRYNDQFFKANRLQFITQFTGTLSECLKEEKRKIYFYRFLPENLARKPIERLLKPPGNPRTD